MATEQKTVSYHSQHTGTQSSKQEVPQLTASQIDDIQKGTFDFSGLNRTMSDIRSSLWGLKMSAKEFKKREGKSQKRFFKVLLEDNTERNDQLEMLKQGNFMQDILNNASNKQHRRSESDVGAGSRRSRVMPIFCQVQVNEVEKFQEISSDEDNERVRNSITTKGVLGNTIDHLDMDEKDTMQLAAGRVQRIALFGMKSENVTSDQTFGEQEFFQKRATEDRRGTVIRKFNSPDDKSVLSPPSPIKKGRKTVSMAIQRKTTIVQKETEPYTEAELDNTLFLGQLFSDSQLNRITFAIFKSRMQDKEVLKEVASFLRQKLLCRGNSPDEISKLEYVLSLCDKDYYIKLRDGQITFSQFFARVAARQNIAHYTVFDDLKPNLADCVKEQVVNPTTGKFMAPPPQTFEVCQVKKQRRAAQERAKIKAQQEANEQLIERGLAPCIQKSTTTVMSGNSKKRSVSHFMQTSNKDTSRQSLYKLPVPLDLISPEDSKLLSPLQSESCQDHLLSTNKIGSSNVSIEGLRSPVSSHQQSTQQVIEVKKGEVKEMSAFQQREAHESSVARSINFQQKLRYQLANLIVDQDIDTSGVVPLQVKSFLDEQYTKLQQELTQQVPSVPSQLNMNKLSQKERNKIHMYKLGQREARIIANKTQIYNSNYSLASSKPHIQREVERLKSKISLTQGDRFFYFQERQNRLHEALELIQLYEMEQGIHVPLDQENERIRQGKDSYKQNYVSRKEGHEEIAFLKQLNDDGCNVIMDPHDRDNLKIVDALEEAIREDTQGLNQDDQDKQDDKNKDKKDNSFQANISTTVSSQKLRSKSISFMSQQKVVPTSPLSHLNDQRNRRKKRNVGKQAVSQTFLDFIDENGIGRNQSKLHARRSNQWPNPGGTSVLASQISVKSSKRNQFIQPVMTNMSPRSSVDDVNPLQPMHLQKRNTQGFNSTQQSDRNQNSNGSAPEADSPLISSQILANDITSQVKNLQSKCKSHMHAKGGISRQSAIVFSQQNDQVNKSLLARYSIQKQPQIFMPDESTQYIPKGISSATVGLSQQNLPRPDTVFGKTQLRTRKNTTSVLAASSTTEFDSMASHNQENDQVIRFDSGPARGKTPQNRATRNQTQLIQKSNEQRSVNRLRERLRGHQDKQKGGSLLNLGNKALALQECVQRENLTNNKQSCRNYQSTAIAHRLKALANKQKEIFNDLCQKDIEQMYSTQHSVKRLSVDEVAFKQSCKTPVINEEGDLPSHYVSIKQIPVVQVHMVNANEGPMLSSTQESAQAASQMMSSQQLNAVLSHQNHLDSGPTSPTSQLRKFIYDSKIYLQATAKNNTKTSNQGETMLIRSRGGQSDQDIVSQPEGAISNSQAKLKDYASGSGSSLRLNSGHYAGQYGIRNNGYTPGQSPDSKVDPSQAFLAHVGVLRCKSSHQVALNRVEMPNPADITNGRPETAQSSMQNAKSSIGAFKKRSTVQAAERANFNENMDTTVKRKDSTEV